MSETIEGKPRNKEVESAEVELKRLELEAKRLELLDLQERINDRKLAREQKGQRAINNGQTLRSIAENDAMAQERCNHHKGGNGADGVIGGQGDDSQYAVLKHQFANGEIWVRCLRCAKTWKPPYREDFETDEAYQLAQREYMAALKFQTRNQMSSSVQLSWKYTKDGSDASHHYKNKMKATTLR